MKITHSIMATCKRDKCTDPIGASEEERFHRLCSAHYSGKVRNACKRQEKLSAACQYAPCGKSLSQSRNKKFCCVEHRLLAHRVIDNDFIVTLVKHSYWTNVESLIKKSPLGLASIDDMGDITDLIELYKIKARHQKSYNAIDGSLLTKKGGKPLKRFIPWLELELCHRYPNSKGGANKAENILIAPASINRMLKDKIPTQKPGSHYNGLKRSKAPIPLETSLLRALSDHFGSNAVSERLFRISRLNFSNLDMPRSMIFSNIYKSTPLFKLLKEETVRLRLRDLYSGLTSLEHNPGMIIGTHGSFILELFAVVCFHALLSGDSEGILEKVVERERYYDQIPTNSAITQTVDFTNYFRDAFTHYLSTYFHINVYDLTACYTFYNRFYSRPPLTKTGYSQ